MLKSRLLCIALLGICLALPAAADEVTLTPVQDAFVCDCIPGATNPMLGAQYLAQGRYSACYNRSFVQWDLSSIPAGSTIDMAVYRVWCTAFYGSPSGQMAHYRVTSAWSEYTVTYNNMPTYTPAGACFTSSWPTANSWHEMDITAFAQGWFDGTFDNYGILAHSVGCTSTCDCAFYSSNISNPSFRPQLVVTYTPESALEETTWGSLKAN